MESKSIASKKLLASVIAAVLALSVISLSIPALSQDEGEEEEENGEETEEEDEEVEEEDEEEPEAEDETEEAEEEEQLASAGMKFSMEVEGSEVEVEIEIEDTDMPDGSYEVKLDCETKPEGQQNPILSGMLVIEDSKGELELEAKVVAGEYDGCTLTFGGSAQQVGGFTILTEEVEEEEEAEAETEEEIDVEAKIVGTSSLAKVKIEFTSSNTDKESLMNEILDKIKLDEETVSNALEIETEEDEELEEKLEVKVEIEDGKAEVEFEFRFVVDSTDRESIIAAIVDKLQTLELDEADIEVKIEGEAKIEVKREYKERAIKKAEEVRESAKMKGKPEFVENIDKAEKYFGKAGRAVVGLKIGLESEDIESVGFGSAQLLLVKMGDKEPMFRAVINVLTDQSVDTMTACLDGKSIGQLEIIHASEELGLSIGHLRQSLTGLSITIPGVTVDIVEGTIAEGEECNTAPMLSGMI